MFESLRVNVQSELTSHPGECELRLVTNPYGPRQPPPPATLSSEANHGRDALGLKTTVAFALVAAQNAGDLAEDGDGLMQRDEVAALAADGLVVGAAGVFAQLDHFML